MRKRRSSIQSKSRRASVSSVTSINITNITTNTVKRKRLYLFSELPAWQQDNDKILTGYVRETNSFTKCIQSLFYFNNESINIYTHLVPSLIYLCISLFLIDTLLIPIFPTTSTSDYMMINTFLLGAFLCLLCSGCFHCLKQHSEVYSNLWSKLDYMGIIILISTSMVPMIYFGFFDHFKYVLFFSSLTIAFAIFCSIVVFNDKFNVAHYRPLRAGFFITFALTGIIPVLTGIYKFGFHGVLQRISLKFICWEALFYTTGALLYGFRFPERLLPGRFDLFGSSHQVFHCLVVIGSICHLKAVIDSYTLMHSNLKTTHP